MSSQLSDSTKSHGTTGDKEAREAGYQYGTQVHKDSYLRGIGQDQTDRSGDALTAAQQREGAVQMPPEHMHPADRAAAERQQQQ